jgi:NADPH:quinone reductase-like Zn-dependent oxidoreductase
MKAIVHDRYGLDGLELRDVAKPELPDDGVLARVRASSVNPADWYGVTAPLFARVIGRSGLRRPKESRVGTDFAGTVEAVGKDVTDVRPGDDVFGGATGAFAEYAVARKGYAKKPDNVSFEDAAAVPIAAITALQGLRDHGEVQPGQKVLVNGASGGVGTYAVQIAKALGAEVTGVCSTTKVELVRSLGADHVVDYTREDFTRRDDRYDVVLDIAGSQPWSRLRRVAQPEAKYVIVGAGGVSHRPYGPLLKIGRLLVSARVRGKKPKFFIAKFNKPDMQLLGEFLESGQVKSVVEQTYGLSEIKDALRHLGEGHARGKIVVTLP